MAIGSSASIKPPTLVADHPLPHSLRLRHSCRIFIWFSCEKRANIRLLINASVQQRLSAPRRYHLPVYHCHHFISSSFLISVIWSTAHVARLPINQLVFAVMHYCCCCCILAFLYILNDFFNVVHFYCNFLLLLWLFLVLLLLLLLFVSIQRCISNSSFCQHLVAYLLLLFFCRFCLTTKLLVPLLLTALPLNVSL